MSRSRRYLNNLPNADEIKELARNILENELKLDETLQNKALLEKETLKLEKELISNEASITPEGMPRHKEKLDELSHDISEQNREIEDLKRNIRNLKQKVNEQIREGLSQLLNQAQSSLKEAEKSLQQNQNLADEAQNNLANASEADFDKFRHEWVLCLEKVIKDQETARKWEKQVEAINRVYRLEFD